MIYRLLVLLIAPILLVAACAGVSCACIPSLNVAGASSLADVLEDISASHPGFHSNVQLRITTGSSTALRTQIEQSPAAFDIFLSADTANPAALMDAALVEGSIVSFATNHLVVVVPAGNPGSVNSLQDLARPGLRIVAAGEGVPITRYTEQLLARAADLPGYGPEFVAAFRGNIVSREDSVGAIVAKIALGEGDAAVVYVTDAETAELETIDLPTGLQVTATYSGVVIAHERTRSYADDFLTWLGGQQAQQILAEHGFSPAP